MAELHRGRLAAVLSTDSHFQGRPRLAPALCSHFDELADTFAIEHRKRVLLEDAFRDVGGQDLVHVISRKAKGCLREIVRAKGKELGFSCDPVGYQRCAWKLDHGADQISDLRALLLEDFIGNASDDRA